MRPAPVPVSIVRIDEEVPAMVPLCLPADLAHRVLSFGSSPVEPGFPSGKLS